MPETIDETLKERGSRYGEFSGHANISQRIKDAMFDTAGWGRLQPDQRECLEMVAHKIARILNGDPNYIDSWHDIIGYVRLVEKRLEHMEKLTPDSQEAIRQNLNPEKSLEKGAQKD